MRLTLAFALLLSTQPCMGWAQTGNPLAVGAGGTGADNPADARTNLGAATRGANSDINSLSGLTTPLTPAQGGTGTSAGVSPTGALSTTPETVINIADYGGCSGLTGADTANVNAALSIARTSLAYANSRPVRVVGGFGVAGVACSVTQVNATGFTNFGAGARLIVEDLTLLCSGVGNICLDTLGSLNVQFNKVTLIGSSTSPPMIGLQEGNVSPATAACCIHTHYGLEITGSFTFAGLYSAASESTTYFAPIIRNNGASLGVIGALGAITGGSGYVNGFYSGVALSGSATGVGALANIVVSGGAVTSVTLVNQGKQFAIGDSLSAASATIGGTGAGFLIPVTNIAQFSMVMDGQNHWGLSSAFRTTSWTPETYYTFTENNIIGGSLRYYGSAYKGAPLWIGSVVGLRTVHLYISQQATGPCVYMFDNSANFTLHNINETLEIECETGSATHDVQLTGSNPAPIVSGLTLVDPLSTVSTAFIGTDTGISSVIARNSTVNVGYSTSPVPLFKIGTSYFWKFDGVVSVPTAQQYNAPQSMLVSGASGGVPSAGAGPIDLLNSTALVAGAYSCARRLAFSYTGPICSVRRASDSTTVDLYPNFAGAIDVTMLMVFCANTSCYIAQEYDQTGNGNVAKNTNPATQPLVNVAATNASAICGSWTAGVNTSLTVTANAATNNLFASTGFASVVATRSGSISNAARLISKAGGGAGWEISGAFALGFGFPQFTVNASSTAGAWVSNSLMPATAAHVFDVNYSSASLSNLPSLGVDGAKAVFQSSTQPSGAISDPNNVVFGNVAAGGLSWPGDICEVILARQSLSAAAIDAIRRNQANFYRIAGVQ